MKSYVIDLSRTMDQWCDSIQTEVEKFDIEFVFQQIGELAEYTYLTCSQIHNSFHFLKQK